MKIGELAKRVGCPVETIRYWEKEGLLLQPQRSDSNYRMFSGKDLERLLFIRNCRALDMSLEEVRQLLKLRDQPEQGCGEVNALIDEHIRHVVEKIEALQALEKQLRGLRKQCSGEPVAESCPILQNLSVEKVDAVDSERDSHLLGLHR